METPMRMDTRSATQWSLRVIAVFSISMAIFVLINVNVSLKTSVRYGPTTSVAGWKMNGNTIKGYRQQAQNFKHPLDSQMFLSKSKYNIDLDRVRSNRCLTYAHQANSEQTRRRLLENLSALISATALTSMHNKAFADEVFPEKDEELSAPKNSLSQKLYQIGKSEGTSRISKIKLDVNYLEKDVAFWKALGASVTMSKDNEIASISYPSPELRDDFSVELKQRSEEERKKDEDANYKGRTTLYYAHLVLPKWRDLGGGEAAIKQAGGEMLYSGKGYDEVQGPGGYTVKIEKGERPQAFRSISLRCKSVPSALAFYTAVLDLGCSIARPTTVLQRRMPAPAIQAGSAILGSDEPDEVTLVLQRYRTRVKPGPLPVIATVQGVKPGAYSAVVVSSPDPEAVRDRMKLYKEGKLKFTDSQKQVFRSAIEETVGAEERLVTKSLPESIIAQELQTIDDTSILELADPDGHRISVIQA